MRAFSCCQDFGPDSQKDTRSVRRELLTPQLGSLVRIYILIAIKSAVRNYFLTVKGIRGKLVGVSGQTLDIT
jgi:hypothetical protein